MFYSTVLLAATAMTGLASAQSPWSFSTNYSTSGAIAINPDSVDYTTRQAWCRAEINSCGQICNDYSSNTCDATSLNYTCVCSDITTPNISSYEQTLPFYICEQWIIDCVAAHPNDLDGQTECQALTCGTKNASSAATTSSSASSSTSSAASSSSAAASTTAAGAATSGSSTASSTASATASGAAVALGLAKSYGTGALAAGMLAAFGLAL